jgi:hypothetical protein
MVEKPGDLIIACRGPDMWQDEGVRKKKKQKRFRAVEAVKALARERLGTPPPSRVVPNRKKKKTEKHKPTLSLFLSEET